MSKIVLTRRWLLWILILPFLLAIALLAVVIAGVGDIVEAIINKIAGEDLYAQD